MEMELNTIIEKIKKEGVGEAEKKAASIIGDAEATAKAALDNAAKEAGEIKKQAEKEAERFKKNGEEAVRQAARDVLLSIKDGIIAVFDAVMKREVSGQLSPPVMKEMMMRLVESFRQEGAVELEALASEKDRRELENLLLSALKEEMKKGVTIKASPSVEAGFRIGRKGDNAYYDFTDDAVAEAFKAYLNPKLAEILDGRKG